MNRKVNFKNMVIFLSIYSFELNLRLNSRGGDNGKRNVRSIMGRSQLHDVAKFSSILFANFVDSGDEQKLTNFSDRC